MAPKLKVNVIKKRMPRWEDTYDAVASLGEGTFGQVLHVKNKTSNVEAALKRVSRWTGGGDHEIALMQHLGSHPNLVQLLDFLTTTDSVCLVVELCGAGDLLNFFHHFEPQGLCHGDEKSVRFLMAGLTLALEHLQGKGVVHRDVKPENIFWTEMLVPKLGDFGAAKFADEIRPSQCSPAYAAPELLAHHQNREVPHSFPVDWWSAGVIAAELLSGRSPVFDAELGDWRFGKFAAIEQKVRQGIPAGLLEGPGSDLVHGLCAQDSSMRFGAKEVQEHPFFDMFDWSGYKDGKSGMATPFCETYEVWKRSLAQASTTSPTPIALELLKEESSSKVPYKAISDEVIHKEPAMTLETGFHFHSMFHTSCSTVAAAGRGLMAMHSADGGKIAPCLQVKFA